MTKIRDQKDLHPGLIARTLLDSFHASDKHSKSRFETHKQLKRLATGLADQFGLRAITEYAVQYNGGKRGLIDVVWLSDLGPIAAFEVDSSRRKKSLRKLLRIPAELKFWVYYGKKSPAPFVKDIDQENLITVIHTNALLETPVHAKSEPLAFSPQLPEVEALLSADLHIRQAVRHCWITLPDQDRSLERLESELTRLVNRVLTDIEEDLLAFRQFSPGKRKVDPPTGSRLASVRKRYPRAYDTWTEEDDILLKRKHLEGDSIQDLSAFFQRSPGAIRSRLRKAGLV